MDKWNIKKQRAMARWLVYKLTGGKIRHSKTGRPFVKRSIDISVSHKDNFVDVAIVPAPYRIGIDIENLEAHLNAGLFLGPVITSREFLFFKKFCESNDFSYSSGIAVFWSIKESFFKCLDYDLKPGKISVLDISKKGKIRFGLSDEIKTSLEEKKLKFCSAKTVLRSEHIFSQTIMKYV